MDDKELDQLFSEARSNPPDTSRLEFGFETRLLAKLHTAPESGWLDLVWRLTPLFAAIAVLIAGYAYQADTDWESSFYFSVQPVASFNSLSGDLL